MQGDRGHLPGEFEAVAFEVAVIDLCRRILGSAEYLSSAD